MIILLAILILAIWSFFTGRLFVHFLYSKGSLTLKDRVLISIPIGFACTLLIGRSIMALTKEGTDSFYFLLLMFPICGLIISYINDYKKNIRKYLSVLSAIPLLLIPIWQPLRLLIQNNWSFAQGVGDDGARWFMMENFLRDDPFQIWQELPAVLRYQFDGRSASLIASALLNSFAELPVGVSTTSVYLFSFMCACLCVIFAINRIFPQMTKPISTNSLLIMTLILLSIPTTFTNLFFSGRLTQVFSILPFFGLVFTCSFEVNLIRRFVLYGLWSNFFTLSYSLRFLPICLAFILLNEYLLGTLKLKRSVKDHKEVLFCVLGLLVSWIFVSYSEFIGISKWTLAYKGTGYGLFGKTLYQNALVWSGFISTWTSLSELSQLDYIYIILLFLVILYLFKDIAQNRLSLLPLQARGIVTFTVFFPIALAYLLFKQDHFLIYKLATYFPYYALSTLIIVWVYVESRRISFLKGAIITLLVLSVSWNFSTKIFNIYSILVTERSSYLDSRVDTLKTLLEEADLVGMKRSLIFGYVQQPESHLLTRAAFSNWGWIPLREEGMLHDYEIRNLERVDLDNVNYDFVLVRGSQKCMVVRFSSKFGSIFTSEDLNLYSSVQGVIEFKSGFVPTTIDIGSEGSCQNGKQEAQSLNTSGYLNLVQPLEYETLQIISFNPDGKLCQDMLTFSNNGAVQNSRITQKGRLCVFSIPRSTFQLGIRMANLQIEARGPVQIVEASWK